MDALSALCRPVEPDDPESKNDFPLVEAATSMRPLSADSPIRTVFTVIPFDTKIGVTLAIRGGLFSSPSLTSRKTPPLAEPPSASRTLEMGIELNYTYAWFTRVQTRARLTYEHMNVCIVNWCTNVHMN